MLISMFFCLLMFLHSILPTRPECMRSSHNNTSCQYNGPLRNFAQFNTFYTNAKEEEERERENWHWCQFFGAKILQIIANIERMYFNWTLNIFLHRKKVFLLARSWQAEMHIVLKIFFSDTILIFFKLHEIFFSTSSKLYFSDRFKLYLYKQKLSNVLQWCF